MAPGYAARMLIRSCSARKTMSACRKKPVRTLRSAATITARTAAAVFEAINGTEMFRIP